MNATLDPPTAKIKKARTEKGVFARRRATPTTVSGPVNSNNTTPPTKSKTAATTPPATGYASTSVDRGIIDDPTAFAIGGHADACIRPLRAAGALGIFSPRDYTRAIDGDIVHVKLKDGKEFQGRRYGRPEDTKIAIVADAPAYHGQIVDVEEIALAAVLVEIRMPVRWGTPGAAKNDLGVIESERLINCETFAQAAFELFAATGERSFDRWPAREQLEFARMKKRK